MRALPIRIIGIDPGLRRTGWGIVESDGVRLAYVASGLITSDSDGELAYRLRELYEGLCGVIASFKPQEAAIEDLLAENRQQHPVVDAIETTANIPLEKPSNPLPAVVDLAQRGVTPSAWTETV